MEQQNNSNNQSFAVASLVFGILALAGFCTIILPLVFGGLSILFAILSRRKGQQISGASLTGILTSVSGIAISVMLIVMCIMMLPQLLADDAYMEQINATAEAMYGQTLDEMLEESYGVSLDELFGLEDTQ